MSLKTADPRFLCQVANISLPYLGRWFCSTRPDRFNQFVIQAIGAYGEIYTAHGYLGLARLTHAVYHNTQGPGFDIASAPYAPPGIRAAAGVRLDLLPSGSSQKARPRRLRHARLRIS